MNPEFQYGKNSKTIKKLLFNKVNDWLQSITDPDLRAKVGKEVIVTGGSIASMLLGQPVNDYDLYLRTKETTKKLAEYYVAQFNKTRNDAQYEPFVEEKSIINCKGVAEERVCIFVRSSGVAAETQETYQYFEDQPNGSIDDNAGDKPKYRPVFLSANAITLSGNVQLVIRFYGEPDQIHDNFDFVHAMSYYDYYKNLLVLPSEALESLLSKTLKYKGSLYPICSLFRTKKFLERGWRVSAGEQLKIAWQISELNLQDIETLMEQLTGCDATYMHHLIEALKNVETKDINSTYVAAIIDRIFG